MKAWMLRGVVAVLIVAGVALSAFAKPRLAVVEFQDNASGGGVRVIEPIRKAVTDLLTTELYKTQLFTMVERARIEEIAREQRLAAAGLIDPSQAVQLGRLVGANAIITGAITEFTLKEYQSMGNNDREGFVTLDVRVIDVETGEILLAAQERGRATKVMGADYFRDVTQVEQEGQGILGTATMDAVRRVVKKLVSEPHLVQAFHVLDVVGGKRVRIDAGSTKGNVKRGDLYTVFIEGAPIVGLDGTILDVERKVLAVIAISKVLPRHSEGDVVKGDPTQVQRGDLAMRLDDSPDSVEVGGR